MTGKDFGVPHKIAVSGVQMIGALYSFFFFIVLLLHVNVQSAFYSNILVIFLSIKGRLSVCQYVGDR